MVWGQDIQIISYEKVSKQSGKESPWSIGINFSLKFNYSESDDGKGVLLIIFNYRLTRIF